MLSHIVRRSNLTTVLAIIFAFALAPVLFAQGPGVATSVTSHGFGGHAGAPGVRASVTSHGSFAPNHPIFHPVRPFPCCETFAPGRPRPVREFNHRRREFPRTFVYGVPYYYPYAYDDTDDYADAPAQDSADQYAQPAQEGDYDGGPTVFDRRGDGDREPNAENRSAENEQPAAAAPEPDPIVPPTVLVFRDGHQLEVANYAIVGDTLYDLTPGHARRVPISQLDVNATQKQNDDRGTDFKLPASPQGS